ncbi:MAG: molybdopterin-dependent oxidoreductase [Planctomycetota bacterium]
MGEPPSDPRVPPGQGATPAWPVVHVGEVPAFEVGRWSLRVHGAVERELELSWGELRAFERTSRRADFHCVTGWSRLDVLWEGVALRAVLARAGVQAGALFVRFADGGFYDTTVPLAHALDDEALLADREAGDALPPEHGGPLRAVVPSLYGWKSCKWLREIELLEAERLGYWEVRGYHNGADPWREERLV